MQATTSSLCTATKVLEAGVADLAGAWRHVSAGSPASEATLAECEQLQHALKAHAVAASAIFKAQQDVQAALDEQLAAASALAGQVMSRQAALQSNALANEMPGVPSLDTPDSQIKPNRASWNLFKVYKHGDIAEVPIGMGMR